MKTDELAPLRGLLDNVLERLAALEAQSGGGAVPVKSSATIRRSAAPSGVTVDKLQPSVTAYDKHIQNFVQPFTQACKALNDAKMTQLGTGVHQTWIHLRRIIHLASLTQKPSGNIPSIISPHLQKAQESMTQIRQLRLDRKWDFHVKAVMEMLVCVSWVVVIPPPKSPTNFVKETVGSSDFWSNKIRKEFKGKDKDQIRFCDTLKAMILDLAEYCKEYHFSGLSWNPRGVGSLEEAIVILDQEGKKKEEKKKSGGGGGVGDIMKELAKKKTDDGSSAATGLKHVKKDQQTWRKEFKKDGAPPPPTSKAVPTPSPSMAAKKKPLGPPVCEYQDHGHKWLIENQTKDSNPDGKLEVEITDPKQQAYIFKCQNTVIFLQNKIKSVVIDNCTKCSVVFDTAISACEIVNCKSMQIQTRGVCPSFTIDKTDGCLIYLSEESVGVSNFVTSKSSEMNVAWTDDKGEQKEVPIPEQFQHKLVDGAITSDVSDLYH